MTEAQTLRQETSPSRAFALLLETASEEFRLASAILSGNFRVSASIEPNEFSMTLLLLRAESTIYAALFKQFLFNCVRARRICEHGADKLTINRTERKAFIKDLADIVAVRDVNEHGHDLNRNKSSPHIHVHFDNQFALDETSLIITGPDQIYMGPLNLADIFRVIEGMRAKAGFHSLHDTEHRPQVTKNF